jgi:hypothetical protein
MIHGVRGNGPMIHEVSGNGPCSMELLGMSMFDGVSGSGP